MTTVFLSYYDLLTVSRSNTVFAYDATLFNYGIKASFETLVKTNKDLLLLGVATLGVLGNGLILLLLSVTHVCIRISIA